MRMSTSLLFHLPVALLASEISPSTQAPTSIPAVETPTVSQPSDTALAFIQTSIPERPFIQDTDYASAEEDLRKRQNTGQVDGAVASATVATQQSPVTTYLAYGSGGIQTPVVFTQLFSAVPEQWDGPTVGSIGLGTITGKVGVVKTKRNLVAEATEAVKNRIERRAKEEAFQKRANAAVTTGALGVGQLIATVGGLILAVWML